MLVCGVVFYYNSTDSPPRATYANFYGNDHLLVWRNETIVVVGGSTYTLADCAWVQCLHAASGGQRWWLNGTSTVINTLLSRDGARLYLAYFQAYTNTYADIKTLQILYDEALAEPDVVGLSIGTRPDCISPEIIALLAEYRARGYEVWLELGLQSAFDDTLARVNRGHGFAEYQTAVLAAHAAGLPICTHLILGLPGETPLHYRTTVERVLALGVEGFKIHPLHVVRGTRLAQAWRNGEYQPLTLPEYLTAVADLVEQTPPEVVFHRLTGTAEADLLLAPDWCSKKWLVLNGITRELAHRKTKNCQEQTHGTRLPSR